MKTLNTALIVLALVSGSYAITGCSTESHDAGVGVKNTAGTYSALIDASPDKVTKAARRAVEDMKLTDITSTSTAVDGRVTAKTALNDAVNISVEQAGDNVSRLTVRVGIMGDSNISDQIIAKTKGNLHWF